MNPMRICPRAECGNPLNKPDDLVCLGDFLVLAGACRGKKRLGQPAADAIAAALDGRIAYRCELCLQWHNGRRPTLAETSDATVRETVSALRQDPRCGPQGLLNLVDAWAPSRVKRESWCRGLDQREALAVP